MNTKIEAVILDWAGTTIDFGCFAPVQAFIHAFEKFGITPTVWEVRKPMGMLKRDHIKTMLNMNRIHQEWVHIHGADFTEEDIDRVYEASEAGILRILKDFAAPKPYVLDTIKTLRDSNIKIGSTTGYTDEMMAIVVPKAAENGYAPDCWFSPNATENFGRPYPYMIFKNLQALRVSSVKNVMKIGDTISDIKEGLAAGVITVGVIEGSSIMALTEEQYQALPYMEKEATCHSVEKQFKEAGADYVIRNFSELPALLEQLS